ncbi:hypothetical protein HPB49_020455 [Dermacentor silvarum]|uniref:Uncharacterized protein n=1 Tax=Dermacentor silvarum TaxID=543639 RepID=A0ACB8E2G7_DERSI|nr:hypothetical protein HPB49_020455 [Dermacentor silvarum]
MRRHCHGHAAASTEERCYRRFSAQKLGTLACRYHPGDVRVLANDPTTACRKRTLCFRDGLSLVQIPPGELLSSLGLTYLLSEAELRSIVIRILPEGNIALLTCQNPSVNTKFLAADPLTVPNFQLAARIYQATPPNTCRGVIHDITPKISSAVLMGNLWDPDSGILTARMMGFTHTALHNVLWIAHSAQGELWGCDGALCPIQASDTILHRLLGLGHPADVCPNTEVIKSLTCGLTLDSQNQPPTCRMGCPHCGAYQHAGDPRWEVRVTADRVLRQTEYARRLRLRVPAKDLQNEVQPSSQQQFIPLTTSLTQAAFVADSYTSTAKHRQNKSASQAS